MLPWPFPRIRCSPSGFGPSNLITNKLSRELRTRCAGQTPTVRCRRRKPAFRWRRHPSIHCESTFKTKRHAQLDTAEPGVLMCGGDQDPTVFFSVNTLTMQAFWAGLPAGLVTVLDVNGAPGAGAGDLFSHQSRWASRRRWQVCLRMEDSRPWLSHITPPSRRSVLRRGTRLLQSVLDTRGSGKWMHASYGLPSEFC